MNFKKDNKLLRVMFLIFFCRLYKFFSRTYFPFFLSTSTNAKYLKNIYFCNNYKKIIFLVIINLLFFPIHSKQNIPTPPALRQGEVRSPGPRGVQVVPARPGLRSAHGGGRHDRPGVRGHFERG